MFVQTSLGKDTNKRETEQTLCKAQTRHKPCMPRKKLSLEQRKKLLEDTKEKLRLEQQARTRERIEQLEFERFDRLGIRLFNEYWTLEGPSDSQTELELCSEEEGDINPQNTPSSSGTKEESSSSPNLSEAFNFVTTIDKEECASSNNTTQVEIPD